MNEHWVDESQANDGDVFQGLVRQSETNTLDDVPSNTLQEHTLEDSTNHNEPMECEPGLAHGHNACVLNGSANDIVAAWDRLTRLARENGFTVHDVPGDGNCLFNAVAYQLDSVSANEMREIVANHLENNGVFYRDFLAQPIQCSNAYSADTEAPSSEDAIIDSVHDYEKQVQLRWERCIHRFRNGAWGDHLPIRAISNEFNVAISVLTSEHSSVIHSVPRSGNVEHEVYIGLILQYHYCRSG